MGHKLVTACFICTRWSFLNKNLFCKFWLCSYFVIYCRRRWWRKSTSCWWMWWRTEVRILRPTGGTEGSLFYFLVTLSRSPNGTGPSSGSHCQQQNVRPKFLLPHFSSVSWFVHVCVVGAGWGGVGDERGSLVVWLLWEMWLCVACDHHLHAANPLSAKHTHRSRPDLAAA
jgi:hypothetical protein